MPRKESFLEWLDNEIKKAKDEEHKNIRGYSTLSQIYKNSERLETLEQVKAVYQVDK